MSMTQTKCPYCGTSVSPAARYCGGCGTPLKPGDQPAPTRRPERSGSRVSGWIAVSLLLLLFVTGGLGGYRYQSGVWPWQPKVQVISRTGEPPTSPVVTAPPTGGQAKPDPALSRYLRSMVSISVRGKQGAKTGSGFIIDTGGHIVTSGHVIEGYSGCVNVIDDNGSPHLGTVVNLDRNLDVAMIYVPTLSKWPDVLSIRQQSMVRGEEVYVLGSPKGTPNAALLPATIEQVDVTKRIDDRYYANLVEFRGATVVHGSSGSPLLHKGTGQVIGVVTAAADTSIAYAVPTDAALTSLLHQWAAAPVATQCGAPKASKTVPLVLAAIAPLSGTYGVWGNDLASGVELAIREMEPALNEVGYEVSLTRLDDQGESSKAREHGRRVTYDREVIGVVGSFTSQLTAAVAEELAESKLVMVSPIAGAEELTAQGWSHFNRLIASEARLQAEAATFARYQLGARSALLILDGSAAAESRARSFQTSAQIVSLSIAGRLTTGSTVDGAELKRRVADSGASVLFYAGNSETGAQVVQTLRREGITLPIVSGTDLYNTSFQQSDWEGVYFTHFTAGRDDRFDKHFDTVLGKPPRGYGMYGYDAARVILEALVRYGQDHPAQVPSRAELAALVRQTQEYPGWSSMISFDRETGENKAAGVYLFEWVKGQHILRQ